MGERRKAGRGKETGRRRGRGRMGGGEEEEGGRRREGEGGIASDEQGEG